MAVGVARRSKREPARPPFHLILIHTPLHASWLNQVEIYFSIVQRKVLTPNDFSSLQELKQRLLAFQSHYEQSASPFNWTFTRHDLNALLAKIDLKRLARQLEKICHRNSEREYLAGTTAIWVLAE
jgi:hypothetical protein